MPATRLEQLTKEREGVEKQLRRAPMIHDEQNQRLTDAHNANMTRLSDKLAKINAAIAALQPGVGGGPVVGG